MLEESCRGQEYSGARDRERPGLMHEIRAYKLIEGRYLERRRVFSVAFSMGMTKVIVSHWIGVKGKEDHRFLVN